MNCNRILVLILLTVMCGGLEKISCEGQQIEPGESPLNDKSIEALHSVTQNFKSFMRDSLKIYAPVSNAFDNDLCRNHSLLFEDGVFTNKMWAWKMLDASSKFPIGIFSGNVIQLGSYDECLGVDDVDSEFGQFSGQHCMVAIGERTVATEINYLLKKELGLFLGDLTDEDIKKSGMPKLSMMWSVCVPSSCRPRDVELHLRSALPRLLGDVTISVEDLACNSRAIKMELSSSDRFAILFFVLVGILVFFSTWYDIVTSNTKSGKELLTAFSVRFHFRRLIKYSTPSPENLLTLGGVKVFTTLWVMFYHQLLFMAMAPAINHKLLTQLTSSSSYPDVMLTNGSLNVDVFFLVTGLLVSFNFFKQRERGITFSLPHFYLHRYIRLTPLYAVMQLFSMTLYTLEGVSQGPFWRFNSEMFKRNCGNWFYSMFYMNNYLPKEDICMGHTWSLSVDMQLFVLSPLILYPLWKWPAVGKLMLAVLTFLGIVIQFVAAYIGKAQLTSIIEAGDTAAMLYYQTQFRYTPWVVGVGVGYALHVTKRTPSCLSKNMVIGGWVLGLTLMLAAILPMAYFLKADYQYDRLTTALYIGLMRPVWALGVAWAVFALVRGYGGYLGQFLSSPVFEVLGRLSYSVYFVHMFVMMSFLANVKTPLYISMASIQTQYLVSLACTLISALVIHLLFEAPATYIESILMRKKKITDKSC